MPLGFREVCQTHCRPKPVDHAGAVSCASCIGLAPSLSAAVAPRWAYGSAALFAPFTNCPRRQKRARGRGTSSLRPTAHGERNHLLDPPAGNTGQARGRQTRAAWQRGETAPAEGACEGPGDSLRKAALERPDSECCSTRRKREMNPRRLARANAGSGRVRAHVFNEAAAAQPYSQILVCSPGHSHPGQSLAGINQYLVRLRTALHSLSEALRRGSVDPSRAQRRAQQATSIESHAQRGVQNYARHPRRWLTRQRTRRWHLAFHCPPTRIPGAPERQGWGDTNGMVARPECQTLMLVGAFVLGWPSAIGSLALADRACVGLSQKVPSACEAKAPCRACSPKVTSSWAPLRRRNLPPTRGGNLRGQTATLPVVHNVRLLPSAPAQRHVTTRECRPLPFG